MKKIAIVIVNYNGINFQKKCLESILNSSNQNFIIIIVDNGSVDKSMEEVEKLNNDKIITIYNNSNLGVAAANNIGIKKGIELGCDFTLLLNNDTEICNNTLEVLINKSDNFDIASPKILFWETHNIWYFGGGFNKVKGRNVHWHYNKIDNFYNQDIVCSYAPTCCLLINNIVFDKIGFMDENYFLYFDDTDFCMRLMNAKIKILVTADTYIYHKVSASTGKKFSYIRVYYLNRNRFYFLKKFKKNFLFITKYLVVLSRYYKMIFGNNDEKKYVKIAYADFKKNKMGGKNFS